MFTENFCIVFPPAVLGMLTVLWLWYLGWQTGWKEVEETERAREDSPETVDDQGLILNLVFGISRHFKTQND